MEMNLYQLFVADSEQAVAFEMLGEIIVYNIFVKIVAVDKKLGIVSEFKHDFLLLRLVIYYIPASAGYHNDMYFNTGTPKCV